MGTITSGIGLVSGIDTNSIITQLIALEQQPVTILQTRISTATAQKQAFTDLQTQLSTIQQIGQSLELPQTFAASAANSTDPNTLTATATAGAAVGSYQFQVARLVTSQQSISNGFASTNALVGAGNISITTGGGDLQSPTTLAQLNGGQGVQRGQFRITDGGGNSSVIDISSAVTLDDVVKKINTALDTSVRASIQGNHLVLNDTSGQTSSQFVVQDLGGGTSAQQLGIVGTTTGTTITGTNINQLAAGTALAALNDGRGVRTAGGASDFQVNLSDGTNVTVSLGSAQTVGDAINAINTAGGSKLKATLNTANNSIDLADTSGGSGAFSVAALNNSGAAKDLGILGTGSGGAIHGGTVLAGLDSVLVSSLNGGSGLALGKISITNRAGATAANIDLSGAKSVQDILDTINNASIGVTASLNNAGDGVQLQDTTGGSGNLVVSDVNSTTAQALGIAGTFDTTKPIISGSNLHQQFVSENTLLSSYNGGKGVTPGSFTITNSAGGSATVDLSSGTFNTIGDVIGAINAKQVGVTASINANGDGILLTDTAGGGSKLTVANVSSTTASDLNIAGTTTTNTIDGSNTKTIAVTATDTLATLQTKIQALGAGVVANLVNDGSGVNGYRLSLTATNSGRNGRVVIDGGSTNLTTQKLVEGQDAAVFFGGADASQSLLVTSSTNQLSNVIAGVNITLTGASASPVTLNVTRDPSSIVTQLQKFTDTFNGVVSKINDLTSFDSTTNTAGLLLGDSTVETIQEQMYAVFQGVVTGAGRYKLLSDVGLTLGDGATIQFDQNKFQTAFATDPDAVKNLFTQVQQGLGTLIDKSMTALVDPVSGTITQENSTIDSQVTQFQSRITDLNQIIADKKARLQEQFANMETVLAGLQSQQSALSSLTGISTAPAKTSSSSTSSTSSTG
ncbi:MAG TPA: flagellar filament capping protein FliD [Tepidisphaeraceae bacterium]|jgi:flagellar hook-associated protein 2|nr:flagellar filament capping protein FliD [Tepidisphaeraceae bacterium]